MGAGTDEVRAYRQPQDRQGARSRRAALTAWTRRQGDRIEMPFAAAHESVHGRFCCRNRHTDGAGRLVHFLKPSIVTRWIVRATYDSTLLTLATLTQRTKGRTVVAGRPTWQACGGSAQSLP